MAIENSGIEDEEGRPASLEPDLSASLSPEGYLDNSASQAVDTAAILAGIDAATASLLAVFNEKLLHDAGKDRQIEVLHAELQQYKSDAIGKLMRPLYLRVTRMHNDLARIIDSVVLTPEPLSTEKAAAILSSFQGDIEDALADHGVTPYREPSSMFDPRRQTAIETVSTDDPDLKGAIAERVRPGFEQGDVILEKERVKVFKYVAAPSSQAE
ncbi:MAG: nucleotide exchange factor GrpE [Phaeospirillum sp.]|nr:nucleotide exchange factor GrpE [Phaeospirillum sp.]